MKKERYIIFKNVILVYLFIINFLTHNCKIANSDQAITANIMANKIKTITPSILSHFISLKPQFFSKTNNLRRKPGSPFLAKGEFLLLEGYVVDILDIPISNAIVKIWQTNYFGEYNHTVQDRMENEHYDIDFENTGTAITDNYGYYSFFTIMPGFHNHYAPYINISIEHESFQTIETTIYFQNHPRNIEDPIYSNLEPKKRDLITCRVTKNENDIGKKCFFIIKLNGLHPTKRN